MKQNTFAVFRRFYKINYEISSSNIPEGYLLC